jgi:hypothetical protein
LERILLSERSNLFESHWSNQWLAFSVIHVQVGFRPGLPEVNSRNRLFAAIRVSRQHQKLFEDAAGAIHPALAPSPAISL